MNITFDQLNEMKERAESLTSKYLRKMRQEMARTRKEEEEGVKDEFIPHRP